MVAVATITALGYVPTLPSLRLGGKALHLQSQLTTGSKPRAYGRFVKHWQFNGRFVKATP